MMLNRAKRLQKTNLYKIYRYQYKFKEFDLKNNLSLLSIDNLIRRLRLTSYNQTVSDLDFKSVLEHINRYL